mmetsp:Transcript_52459/g.97111  ORF Transcript_52459/g.97111 Transcript_52459/m.97111 type:complete len:277 (+) Transcript_52459:1251-2081(+)
MAHVAHHETMGLGCTAEGTVVARVGESNVLRGAGVDLHRLLKATVGEGANGIHGLVGDVNGMRGQTHEVGVGQVASPLLIGDEEVILNSNAFTPLVLLLQVRRAERHHHPIGLSCDRLALHGPIASCICGRKVGALCGCSCAVSGHHLLTLQVVHSLDDAASTCHHVSGRVVACKEACHHGSVVVNVHHVGAREVGSPIVDLVRHGFPACYVPIRLGLTNHANSLVISKHRAKAIRNTNHAKVAAQEALTNCCDGLQVAMREVHIAIHAVQAVVWV